MRCYNCIKYVEEHGQCEVTSERVNKTSLCSILAFAENHWRKDIGGECMGTITYHK